MQRNHTICQSKTLSRSSRQIHSTLLGHRGNGGYRVRRTHLNHHPPAPVPNQPSEEELQRQAELEKDLQLARDIQQGLLLAAVPYLPGWEFSALSLPARDLGGDLYDFLTLSNGYQAIMIGDVSGKGLQAALRMAVTRTLFRHEARMNVSSTATLAAVNRNVCSDIPQGMVTMLYAILDPRRGVMHTANAGHTYPLLFKLSVRECELPGMPLGVIPDIDYEEEEIPIQPGDSVFLYTDGVNEATSQEQEEFGFDRLRALLEANSQMKPRSLMKIILNEVRSWSTGMPQSDDITMVVVRRRFSHLSDELQVVANDVLQSNVATEFWQELEAQIDSPLTDATAELWMEWLPIVTRLAKQHFSRGLSRELSQQFRLTIEEYRTDTQGDES
jgi:sigma-B regulation protein RsbU (phosphoserine phosphatase)